MAIAAMSVVSVLTTPIQKMKDFKNKKQELTLVMLGSHLRIEESLGVQDSDKPKGNNVVGPQKILVSSGILNNYGYEQETKSESDKFVLSKHGLSQGFWGEAMVWGCRIVVRLPDPKLKTLDERGLECIFIRYAEHSKGFRVPNKRNKITPYELWTKKKPNLNYLRVWGCRIVVRLPDPKLKTLDERGLECIFIRYAEHSKGFSFYVIEPDDSVSINSVIESKNAIFDENRFSSVPRLSLRIPNETEDIAGSMVSEEVTKEVVQQPKPELRKIWA
nr:zinc finger, CCHC-type [Tanacetum cinerariifolium]